MQTRASRVGTGHQDGSGEAAKLVLGGLGMADIAQGKNLKAINLFVGNWKAGPTFERGLHEETQELQGEAAASTHHVLQPRLSLGATVAQGGTHGGAGSV